MITTPNQAQAIIDQANQAIIDEQQKTMAELKTHLDNLSSTTLGISTSLNSAVSALAAANGLSHTIIPSTTESTTPTTQEAQSATEIKLAPNQASVKNTNASNMNPGTS